MRNILITLLLATLGCGHHIRGNDANGSNTGPDACIGLACQVVDCEAINQPPTTITGTVYAPNGTLPLYGINVYVPNSDPGPLPTGLSCSQCSDPVPGDPIGTPQQTNEAG